MDVTTCSRDHRRDRKKILGDADAEDNKFAWCGHEQLCSLHNLPVTDIDEKVMLISFSVADNRLCIIMQTNFAERPLNKYRDTPRTDLTTVGLYATGFSVWLC